MHQGVREFVRWVESKRDAEGMSINAPATRNELMSLEQVLRQPLPEDFRLLLARFNGGQLPMGKMLPCGMEPGSIGAAIRDYAESVERDFLDPELLLPFFHTLEGSLLAFDRSAGPVSDTWPVVDYYPDTGEHRLVYRTFDGFCRRYVLEWQSEDWGADFTVDTYLRSGLRHARAEPDVPTAHATVAHAYRRAGEPRLALASYLKASRCVPPLHWVEWEALKLATILGDHEAAMEALAALAAPAPVGRWNDRETTSGRVAEVVGILAQRAPRRTRGAWLGALDQLAANASDDEESQVVVAVREAIFSGGALPEPRPIRDQSVCPPGPDTEEWFGRVKLAYLQGLIRDEDLVLDTGLRRLSKTHNFEEVISARRDF